MEYILGVDPGVNTGWSIHNLSSEELCGYGVVKKANLDIDTIKQYTEIFELFKDIQYLAIETQYLSKNPHSLIKIVESRAMMVSLALQRGCKIFDVHPTQWIRNMLNMPTLRGRQDIKHASKKTVKLIYNLDVKQDIADAILIGRYAIGYIKINNFAKTDDTHRFSAPSENLIRSY